MTIDALTNLTDRVKACWPEASAHISQLAAELRLISQKGFDPGRTLLGPDLTNLTHNLGEICDFREAGVVTPDVEAAQADTLTLAADMRKRAVDIIRDRGSLLRINAEAAALRADPDAAPQDLTDSFRLLIAAPATETGEASLIVQDIGLPEMGGQAGRVLGKVICASLKLDPGYVQEAAPFDTFYLPAGNQILLRKGEQIILRDQGLVWNSEISLNDFEREPEDTLVEAEEDGVRVFGPATLTTHASPSLCDVRERAHAMSAVTKSASLWTRFRTSEKALGKAALISVAGATLGGIGLASYTGVAEFILISILPASGAAIVTLANDIIANAQAKRIRVYPDSAMSPEVFHAAEQAFLDAEEVPASHADTYGYARSNAAETNIFSADVLRFYAVRKAVVSEGESIRVIRPVAALEAPKPETVVPFTPAKKATA